MTDLRFVEHPSGLHILQRSDKDSGATFKTDKIKRYIVCFGGCEILSKFR